MFKHLCVLIFISFVIILPDAHAQNVFTVTKTGDPDPFTYPYNYVDSLCDTTMYGTLQWAIRKANDAPDSSVINFNISGSGTHTITLNYTLPTLNKPIKIDGTTQSGYSYNNGPNIIIDGTNIPYNSHCFNTSGSSERYVIKGLCIRNFYLSYGVLVWGPNAKIIDNVFQEVGGYEQGYYRAMGVYIAAPHCIIQGNILGTDTGGVTNLGSTAENIVLQNQWLDADSCIIGGTGTHEANTITNSTWTGIAISNGKNNKISRNRIYNNDVAINLTLWAGEDWWGNEGKAAPLIDTIAPTGILFGTSEAYDTIEIFGSTGTQNANEYITTVTADTNGNWNAAISNYNWDYLVATATDDSSNTSELSSAFEIVMDCSAEAGSNDTICLGGSTQLNANEAYTYNWASSPADNSLTGQTSLRNPVVSPTVATTYTVTVSNAMGCTATDAVVINVYGMLAPGDIGNNQTICYKTAPEPFFGSTPTGGDGIYTYIWQKQPNCTGVWTDISGATAITYAPDTLTATNCYRRLDFNACDTVMAVALDSGLVGYWSFDGDCKDYSGTGVHGTGTNVTWGTDRSGNVNNTAVFNGNAYVSLNNPQNLLTDLSKFSISAWIKTTSNSYMQRIVTLHYGDSKGSSISIMERSGKFDFYLKGENSYYTTNVYINDGQWHLVALTFDGSAYKAYIDSLVVLTVNSSNYSTLGSYNRNIGTYDGGSYNFNGSIDEVRVYNRALSLSEINALWQAPFLKVSVLPVLAPGSISSSQTICKNTIPVAFTATVPSGGTGSYTYRWQQQPLCSGSWSDISGAVNATYQAGVLSQEACFRRKVISSCDTAYSNTIAQGLKARYPFNNDYFDRSGNNYHCTNYGALWTTDKDNTANSALNFTGSQYTDLNYGSGLNPATAPHTFSLWVKASSTGNMMVMSAGQAGGTDNRFYIGIKGGKWDMGIHTTPWSSGTINATLDWTHIAVVMDGTTATLYVNGNVSRTISYTSYNFNRNIWLGNHNNTFWYNGKIDEVQIFDRALSQNEIVSLYNNPDVRIYINQISNPGIIGPTQAVCYHAQPASFTGSLPAGTDSTYLYQWQQQYGCAGNWSDITGATASTYLHNDTLPQTSCFRRLAISSCDTLYANVSDSGLAAYWLFNGDLNDYSGHGFYGTGTNTTFTTGRNDKLYHALNFNGSAYVSLSNPQNLLPDLSEFTISTWVKTTASTTQSRILTLHYGTTAGSSIALMERSGKYDIYLRGESNYYSTGVSINNGQWRHLILSYDGATYKAYVDGSQVFSLASANYSTLGSYNRNIGTYNGSMYNFTGSIDEMRIYNRALTDDEIYSMYHDAIKITIHPLPTANAGPDTLIFAGDSVQMGTDSMAGCTYMWSPGTGLSDSTVARPWSKPLLNTTYYLTVTDTNGCNDFDSVVVTIHGASCGTAIELVMDTSTFILQPSELIDSVLWFVFTAIPDSCIFNTKNYFNDTIVYSYYLYDSICENLNEVENSIINDSLIYFRNLYIYNTYYIKIIKNTYLNLNFQPPSNNSISITPQDIVSIITNYNGYAPYTGMQGQLNIIIDAEYYLKDKYIGTEYSIFTQQYNYHLAGMATCCYWAGAPISINYTLPCSIPTGEYFLNVKIKTAIMSWASLGFTFPLITISGENVQTQTSNSIGLIDWVNYDINSQNPPYGTFPYYVGTEYQGPHSAICTNTSFNVENILEINYTNDSYGFSSNIIGSDVCVGENNGSASAVLVGGNPPYSFIWSNNQTTQDIDNLSIGLYSVTITDENGCSTTNSIEISEYEPAVGFSVTNLCQTNATFQSNTYDQNLTYEWDFENDGNFVSFINNPQSVVHNFPAPGNYLVTQKVTDVNMCSSFYSQLIQVIPSVVGYNENCCSNNATYTQDGDFTASTNATWTDGNNPFGNANSPIKVRGTIWIPAGIEITIEDMTFEFDPNSRVIVEREGNLTLDNSIFMGLSSCETMWQGIEVWGDAGYRHYLPIVSVPPSPPVSDVTGQSKQGKLIMLNEATIQDAHTAVLLGRSVICIPNTHEPNQLCKRLPYLLSYDGGIIVADDAIFKRNAIGVKFLPFKPAIGTGYVNYNASKITNCTFESSGTLFDPGYSTNNPTYQYPNTNNPTFANANDSRFAVTGIYQWAVRNVTLTGNIFGNDDSPGLIEGIKSYDSPCNVSTSLFQNLDYGIRIFNSNSTMMGNQIINNKYTDGKGFKNIYENPIQIESSKFSVIKENSFNDPGFTSSWSTAGILLKNSMNFRVQDNDFYYINKGIEVINSSPGFSKGITNGFGGGRIASLNRAQGNDFVECPLDIETKGYNQRLQLHCNASTNTDPDYYNDSNWENYGYFTHQGQLDNSTEARLPAGNAFFPENNDSRKVINNNFVIPQFPYPNILPVHYHYYRHGGSIYPERIPSPASQQYNINDASSAYNPQTSCLPCSTSTGSYRSVLQDIEAEYDSLVVVYDTVFSNLDSNATQILLDSINGSMNDDSLLVLLLAHSPLSDTVIAAALNRPLSTNNIDDLLIPNSPLSDVGRYYLDMIIDTLPSEMQGRILEVQAHNPYYTTLSSLDRDMLVLENSYQLELNSFIEYLLENDSLSEAITILDSLNNNDAKRLVLSTYLADSNYTEVVSRLENFEPLTKEEEDWKDLFSLLYELATDSLTVFDMDSTQEVFVRALAEDNTCSPASVNAQAILRLLYEEEFPECPAAFQERKASFTWPTNKHKTESGYLGQNIPNPFSNTTLIPYYLPENTVHASICIYDITGKKIHETVLQNDKGTISLTLDNFKSGIYLYSLIIDNKPLQTKRMVLIK